MDHTKRRSPGYGVQVGILLVLGALGSPVAANQSEPGPAAAEHPSPAIIACAAAAAAWWRGEPGIAFEAIDPDTAIPRCQQALQAYPEDAEVRAHLCRALTRAQRFDAALEQCRQAATAGSAAGQWSLGALYEFGRGVAPDHDEAAHWYHRAAQQSYRPALEFLWRLGEGYGNLRAQLLLAAMYEQGDGVEPDEAQAVRWYRLALSSSDSAQRRRAVEGLARLHSDTTVPDLIAALGDEDESVRRAAISALGELGDLRTVAPLIVRLADEDAGDRRAAAWVLGWRLGDGRALAPLIARLADEDWWVRAEAAGALGQLGDPRVVEPLIMRLADEESSVRQEAARVLGVLGDVRSVEPLIALLEDEYYWVRKDAAEALGMLRDPRALEPLIARLVDEDIADSAAMALGWLGDPRAVEPLIAQLEDGMDDIIAWALSFIDDARAVDALLQLLGHRDWFVRFSAALGLANSGDVRAVEALLEVLADADSNWIMRISMELGELDGARAMEALLTRLEDEDESVRSSAAWALGALGSLGDARAVGALIDLLEDEDELVRANAAASLGSLGDVHAVKTLIELLEDEDEWVRHNATLALGRLGDVRAVEPLIALLEDTAWQTAAAEVLGRLDGLNVTRLQEFIPAQGRSRLYPLLATASRYGTNALPLAHHATHHTAYARQLEILGLLRDWHGDRAVVSAETLAADLAALRDPAPPAGAEPEAVDTNPYVSLFLAQLHQENGRHAQALEWAEHGLTHTPEHQTALRIVLGWLQAEALWHLGRIEAALAVLQAIETELLPRLAVIERRRSGLAFEPYTRLLQGLLLQELDREAEALDVLHRAETDLQRLARQEWYGEEPAARLRALVLSLRAALEHPEADADAIAALALLEDYPPQSLLGRHAERRLLGARVRQQLAAGHYTDALALAERLLLHSQQAPGRLTPSDAEQQQAYERLQRLEARPAQLERELQTVRQQLAQAAPEERQSLEQRLQALQRDHRHALQHLQDYRVDLKRTHPRLAALVAGEPQDPQQLQQALAPGQLLLHYLLLDEQGWVFRITAEAIEVHPLGRGRRQLEPMINDYRALLQLSARSRGYSLSRGERGFQLHRDDAATRSAAEQARTLAERLSAVLLGPLELHEAEHLLIIPNGPLHQLPFAALPWQDGYLIDRHTLTTLSSASLLAVLNSDTPAAHPPLTALGNPTPFAAWLPLPGAEAEVRALAAHFPDARIHLHDRASRAVLLEADLGGRLLHLAVHGQAGTLEQTRLVLSDGYLDVREIWGLSLEASPLVVLSACETHLGERLGGDEVVSLTNGFLFSGAQAVIGSLWPVADDSTKELMEHFYSRRPHGQARALAHAQRRLIADGLDPYHWAGFVIAGW